MKKFVNFAYLKHAGIVDNRPALRRMIDRLGFPPPIQIGENRLVFPLDEIEKWIAERPRSMPQTQPRRNRPLVGGPECYRVHVNKTTGKETLVNA